MLNNGTQIHSHSPCNGYRDFAPEGNSGGAQMEILILFFLIGLLFPQETEIAYNAHIGMYVRNKKTKLPLDAYDVLIG